MNGDRISESSRGLLVVRVSAAELHGVESATEAAQRYLRHPRGQIDRLYII
jgi:hypothetical protein